MKIRRGSFEAFDGGEPLEMYEEFEGKKVLVVGSEHGDPAVVETLRNILDSEVKSPEEWLFAIEGGETTLEAPEVKVVDLFAKEKEIPIADPIIDPFNSDILNLLLKSKLGANLDKQLALGQLGHYLIETTPVRDEKVAAVVLGVPDEELVLAMAEAKADEIIEDVETHKKEVSDLLTNLILVSNAVSVQVLKFLLKKHKDRSRVLLSVGRAHAHIFNTPNLLEYLNLELSDDEIEELVRVRNAKYKAQKTIK